MRVLILYPNQCINYFNVNKMKKLIYGSLFLAILGIGIVGCKKKNLTEITKRDETRNIVYSLDRIPNIPNEQNVAELLLNPRDKDEEKLNKYLYEIGVAIKPLIKESDFNQIIIDLALNSDSETAYLLDLKEKSPYYFKIINENLGKVNLSLESIADDMTHTPLTGNPKYPETMEVEKYVPAIFIPNLAKVDKLKQPLLSPNVEVNAENNSDIEDYIVTWYFDEAGKEFEIILGEETSLSTTNPLFLVDHASPKGYLPQLSSDKPQISNNEVVNTEKGFDDITNLRIKQIGIKSGYRYETGSWNRSEFALIVSRTSTGYPTNFEFMNDNNDHSTTLTKMHPGTLNFNHHFVVNYLPIYGSNGYKVYWNTFERDWNRQPKSLGYALNVLGAPGNIDDVVLAGRMRYNGDWYQWIPSTLHLHRYPIEWYQWETEVNWNNWKSNINVYPIEY